MARVIINIKEKDGTPLSGFPVTTELPTSARLVRTMYFIQGKTESDSNFAKRVDSNLRAPGKQYVLMTSASITDSAFLGCLFGGNWDLNGTNYSIIQFGLPRLKGDPTMYVGLLMLRSDKEAVTKMVSKLPLTTKMKLTAAAVADKLDEKFTLDIYVK